MTALLSAAEVNPGESLPAVWSLHSSEPQFLGAKLAGGVWKAPGSSSITPALSEGDHGRVRPSRDDPGSASPARAADTGRGHLLRVGPVPRRGRARQLPLGSPDVGAQQPGKGKTTPARAAQSPQTAPGRDTGYSQQTLRCSGPFPVPTHRPRHFTSARPRPSSPAPGRAPRPLPARRLRLVASAVNQRPGPRSDR